MKKYCFQLIIVVVLLCMLCGCHFGPNPVPFSQSLENVVKIEIIDSRKDEGTIDTIIDYDEYVLYTLTSEQMDSFLIKLQSICFYRPIFEPTRQLGEITVRIHYEDGYSDLLGLIHNEYIDPNQKIVKIGVRYPDKQAFYDLICEYADVSSLPEID